MIDTCDQYFNLITRFNDIVRYNVANNITPSRELFVAEDYINHKVDASDIFNPNLNNKYLKELSTSDKSSYDLISKLLN